MSKDNTNQMNDDFSNGVRARLNTPGKDPWKSFRHSLNNFTDDFMEDGRVQGSNQEREELFTEKEVTEEGMIEVVEAK